MLETVAYGQMNPMRLCCIWRNFLAVILLTLFWFCVIATQCKKLEEVNKELSDIEARLEQDKLGQ